MITISTFSKVVYDILTGFTGFTSITACTDCYFQIFKFIYKSNPTLMSFLFLTSLFCFALLLIIYRFLYLFSRS